MILKAGKQDLDRVVVFLLSANLGTDGLTEETVENFLVLQDEAGSIRGSLGIEAYKEYGLLRSLVVSPPQAEKEIFILFNQMLKLAREKGITSLFLATNKSAALSFFEVLGFRKIRREEIPNEFYGSDHIRHILNVDNSVFLKFSQ